MRRSVIMLTAVLGCVTAFFGVVATNAWADGEAVQGTLAHGDEPVAGVTINVFTEVGGPVGSAVSAEDGTWTVPVSGSGTYRVDLDQSTLPEGLVVHNGRPSLTVSVFAGNVRNVLFPLGTGVTGGPSEEGTPGGTGETKEPADSSAEEAEDEVVSGGGRLDRVISLTYSGLHFGLTIALAALGLSLIFGTMGLTNFAHGELVTFGALMAFLFNIVFGVPLLVSAVIAVALGGLFGWVQDRLFWGWLRRRGTGLIAMMIISIGVGLMLRFAYLYAFGGQTRRYDEFVTQPFLELGPLTVVPKVLISDAVAVVVLVAVALALLYTRLGKATRAVADNPALAASSGINVDRVIRLVWAVGGGLAALSGVILAVDQGIHYQMGLRILLLVFAAVVLGGLGTAFGALVGALIVGVFIQLSTLWIPNDLKYAGALAVLIVILMVRPQGILGRRERIG